MRNATLSASVARRALDAAVTGVVIVDMTAPGHPVTYVNAGFERITGYSSEDVLGRNCRFLQGPATDPATIAELSRALKAGEECRVTVRNHRADGSPFWNELSLAPVADDAGRVVEYIGIQNDVTERQDALARAEHLAYHDALTGLANRHAVELELARATAQARDEASAVALLYLDLDGFKRINDTLGHTAGDELLRQVADRLSELIRPGDVLARQGGDEFLILLDRLGRDAEATAVAVARRLVEALRQPFKVVGAQVKAGGSVGISLFPRDAGDAATLLKHADTAMYRAKSREGSRWAFYDGRDQWSGQGQVTIPTAWSLAPSPPDADATLEAMLTGTGLSSIYQPLVDLESGEVVAYEALARGPKGTPLERPDALFDAARRAGRLAELDWACRAAAVRGALAAGLPSPLRLFVNVEPDAVGMPCPPQFEELWRRAGELDVVVEVTERP